MIIQIPERGGETIGVTRGEAERGRQREWDFGERVNECV